MKKIIYILLVLLLTFSIIACSDSSDDMSENLKKIGDALNDTNTVKPLTEEEIVNAAIAETKSVLAANKETLLTTDTSRSDIQRLLKDFSNLAAKYEEDSIAFSAVKTYLKYAILEETSNTDFTGTELESNFTALKAKGVSAASDLFSAALNFIQVKDSFNYCKWISKKIPLKTPSCGNSSQEWDGLEKTFTVNYEGYSTDYVTFTIGNPNGFTNDGLTFKSTGLEDSKVECTITFTINDNYKDYLTWDSGDSNNPVRTVKLTVDKKDKRTNADVRGVFKYSDTAIDSPSTKGSNPTVYSYVNDACVKLDSVTSSLGNDVLISISLEKDGTELYSDTTSASNLSTILNNYAVKNPGNYHFTVQALVDESTYKGNTKNYYFKITDPLDDATEKIKNYLIYNGAGLILSFLGENHTMFLDMIEPNTLEEQKNTDEPFYKLLKDRLPESKDSDKVYFYSDLLTPIFFKEVVDTLEEIIGILSMENNYREINPIFVSSVSDVSTPLTAADLGTFAGPSSFFKKAKGYFDEDNFAGAVTLFKSAEAYPEMIKLCNAYGFFNNPIDIMKNPVIVEKLNWLIACLKAGVTFNDNICIPTDDGLTFWKSAFMYSDSPYLTTLKQTITAFTSEEECNTYIGYLDLMSENCPDFDALISDSLELIKEAFELEETIEK